MKKKKYLCLIPARSGSQRLKNKNLKKINGKTLVDITINLAKKSKIFNSNDIILSSNSNSILKIGNKHKINTIKRSNKNSNSRSNINSGIKETFESLNYDFHGVFLLQVTSPLRKISTLKDFKKFCEKRALNHCLTVTKFHGYISKYSEKFFNPSFKIRRRTQDLKPYLYENGLLYYFSKKFFEKNNRIYPKKNWNFYVSDKYESLDINDKNDYEICKKLNNL